MERRNWLIAAAALAAAGCGILGSRLPAGRVVQIRTKKFEFVPNAIVLARGEPVVLELIATDVAMGFKCPRLGLRGDVTPGKPARLQFTPQSTGKFSFFCDVFCGDGHEDMDGTITVTG